MTSNVVNGAANSELIEMARAGDAVAWSDLVRRYESMVTGVASRYRMQEADRADAIQNAWLRAVEQLAGLRDPRCFGGWMAAITARECLSVIRRGHRDVPAESVGDTCSPVPGPESAVLAAEVARSVERAVAGLTGLPRQVIGELFGESDRTYAAISRATGIPAGSIGPIRGRALRLLRTRLEGVGFDATTIPA